MLHRASMKYYERLLLEQGYTVHYIESNLCTTRGAWTDNIDISDTCHVHYIEPTDTWLLEDIQSFVRDHTYTQYESPLFLLTPDQWYEWHDTQKHMRMHDFYKAQRQRFNILIDEDGSPAGGSWSYDADNRKPFPKRNPPSVPMITPPHRQHSDIIEEARAYTLKNFKDNYGSCDNFIYPITHDEARESFEVFLRERFALFGPYEDAITQEYSFLFHSILTPYLNIGLITPQEIIDMVQKYTNTHSVPLSSHEGFIRQIIGWREFMRGVYISYGTSMRTRNYFNHTRPLPDHYWHGTTSVTPIDHTIHKIKEIAYAHHIERLMVIGSHMLMCRYSPDDIYRWFMEMFIDSYDWVMVPNVYGMSQFADGGIFATKPYISGSHYVKKMSNYKTDDYWPELWDALFWCFIDDYQDEMSQQARMPFMIAHLKKKTPVDMKRYRSLVKKFFDSLDTR